MSRSIRTLLCLASLCAFASACGDDATPAGDPDGGAVVAPLVSSTSPANGAVGVVEDAAIVITFSRPMDPASTVAAYSSDDLPAEKVVFSWNAAGDVLTITPIDPLVYATGGADVVARAYTVRIGAGATDTAGVPLAADAVVAFTTLRRIEEYLPRIDALTGLVSGAGVGSADFFAAGDSTTDTAYCAFASFELGMIPGGADIVGAYFAAAEDTYLGMPDDDLGGLYAQHVVFDALDTEAYEADLLVGAPNQIELQRRKSPPYARSVEATEFVVDDLLNRSARSDRTQMRFRFEMATDSDGENDRVWFDPESVGLRVIWLQP